MYCRGPLSLIPQECRWRERWRYIEVEPEANDIHVTGEFRDHVAGTSPLGCDDFGKSSCDRVLADVRPKPGFGTSPAGALGFGNWLREAAKVGKSIGHHWSKSKRGVQVYVVSAIPPPDDYWAPRGNWKLAVRGRWRWPGEHTNIKEARDHSGRGPARGTLRAGPG